MRTLVLVSFLFLSLLCVILLNYQYANSYAHSVLSDVEGFLQTTPSDAQLAQFIDRWHAHKRILSLTVNYRELDRMEELILMLAYYNEKNEEEFRRTCVLIANAAQNLVRLEQLSFENIC